MEITMSREQINAAAKLLLDQLMFASDFTTLVNMDAATTTQVREFATERAAHEYGLSYANAKAVGVATALKNQLRKNRKSGTGWQG